MFWYNFYEILWKGAPQVDYIILRGIIRLILANTANQHKQYIRRMVEVPVIS